MIPEWLRDWMHGEYGGPYTHRVNGQTMPRRDEVTAWSEDHPLAHTVPCCQDHNGTLNERFEGAMESVIAFLKGAPADDQCALWLVKTGLLFWHPTCKIQSDVPLHLLDPQPPRIERVPLEPKSNVLYDWMVTGQEPPDWIALWVGDVCHKQQPEFGSRPLPGVPITVGMKTSHSAFLLAALMVFVLSAAIVVTVPSSNTCSETSFRDADGNPSQLGRTRTWECDNQAHKTASAGVGLSIGAVVIFGVIAARTETTRPKVEQPESVHA